MLYEKSNLLYVSSKFTIIWRNVVCEIPQLADQNSWQREGMPIVSVSLSLIILLDINLITQTQCKITIIYSPFQIIIIIIIYSGYFP